MPILYFKLVPLIISGCLFLAAFRVHERYWSLGFFGWKRIYLGLASLFLGSLAGVFFEFSELRRWQEALGWPLDWIILGVGASLGVALVLRGAVERLSLAAQEKDELERRQEAFELFDSIRDAAHGPYSFLEILSFSLKEILRKIGADAGGVWLLHPSGREYILASASGFTLSLQQKLEQVSAGHPGFSRAVSETTPREIADPAALQQLFPEFYSPRGGYGSVLTVPLIGGHGRLQNREALGLLICCAGMKGVLSPADGKLIGSAVAFLAMTISEVRLSRVVRNERRASQHLRATAAEFSIWVRSWSAEASPQSRLHTAVNGLAELARDFIGCGLYVPGENRWEPLALATMETDQTLLGSAGFREAATRAVQTGRETSYPLPAADGRSEQSSAYRMIPVFDPANSEQNRAVLFIPVLETPPSWWPNAIAALAEMTRVLVLLRDNQLATAIKSEPDADEVFDSDHLFAEIIRRKPEELPLTLAEALPEGWRAALWQSCPGDKLEYRLRLAAASEGLTVYHSPEKLPSAPRADRLEVNAHLGGLVRVDYKEPGVLTELWPDFGDGWRALRFPVLLAGRNRGWLSVYHRLTSGEVDESRLRSLKTLAAVLELVIARWDASSPDIAAAARPQAAATGDEQSGRQLSDNGKPRSTIDRAMTDWIAAQPERTRPGRIDFNISPGHAPTVETKLFHEILDWGAENLADGMLEASYLTVNALVDNGRISIVFDRMAADDEGFDSPVWQPAVAIPVKQSVRETLDRWDAKSRIINSTDGPRKFILNFIPQERNVDATDAGAAKNILVVDDEELIRDLLLGMLDVLGYQATAATSVEEGLEYINSGKFTSIITGHSAPVGGDFARQVKELRPNTRIILVGEPGNSHRAAATVDWADATLIKPFRIDDLKTVLETAPVVSSEELIRE